MYRLLILSFFCLLSKASAFTLADLRTGDLLLQSVPCYLCSLIEIEEGGPYSHVGIVLINKNGVEVLESWNQVEIRTLASHLALRKKGTSTLVRRPTDSNGNELMFNPQAFRSLYLQEFAGHHYDSEFLWDNRDAHGETYYCSEFAAKFLNHFLLKPLATKPMHFNQYRADWIQFFNGIPPDGKPGISPADLARSPLLKTVGEL